MVYGIFLKQEMIMIIYKMKYINITLQRGIFLYFFYLKMFYDATKSPPKYTPTITWVMKLVTQSIDIL